MGPPVAYRQCLDPQSDPHEILYTVNFAYIPLPSPSAQGPVKRICCFRFQGGHDV